MKTVSENRRHILLGGILAAASLPAAKFAFAQSEKARVINYGAQNTSWGAVAMVADHEKIFDGLGLATKPYIFDSGKAVRDAMIANRIDIGVLGTTPMIVGVAKGDMQPLAMAMYAGKTLAIVVKKDSGIKSIADLKGKKVASQLGSSTDQIFQTKILEKYGLQKSDIQTINVKFGDQVAALVSGSVDAFAGVEPYPSVAEIAGIGTVLLDYSAFDILPVWLVANNYMLKENPDEVVQFLRGWIKTTEIFKSSPDVVSGIILDHFRSQGYDVDKATIDLMMSKIDVNPFFNNELADYLKAQSDTMVELGQLSASPDWGKILDNSMLQKAAASL